MQGFRLRRWWPAVSVALLLLLLVGTAADALPAWWQVTIADGDGSVGQYTSLALDASGNPHISYYDAANAVLKYAVWTGSQWTATTVDATRTVGYYTSLALDAGGNPHISYYDDRNTALKYAAWTGSRWDIVSVDETDAVGQYTSLALDASGYPHISYYDAGNTALKYTAWDGSRWNSTTVDDSGSNGEYTSLALDANGYPHISYYDSGNGALKYTAWDGSRWSTTTVDYSDGVGQYTSLALDAHGYPHISYFDASGGALKYTAWDGSRWNTTTVDDDGVVGLYTSLALDGNGNPHISYYDSGNGALKYTAWDGNHWEITTVNDSGSVGWFSSLALDTEGYPHISYYDFAHAFLKYASLDTIAPTTSATATTVDTTPYTFDTWTNQSVSVSLFATDTGGSGVANTFYTLNGTGQLIDAPGTPIVIDTEGTTILEYWSVDVSGNEGVHQTVTIKFDPTPPAITYSGNPESYTVDQTVDIHCQAADALSGIATTDCREITGAATDFDLGLTTITNSATDMAGNTGSNSISFTVGVTYESLCRLTGQDVNDARLARQLCAPLAVAAQGQRLQNAQLERAGTNMYILLVNTQRGRGLTAVDANRLIRFAQSLQGPVPSAFPRGPIVPHAARVIRAR